MGGNKVQPLLPVPCPPRPLLFLHRNAGHRNWKQVWAAWRDFWRASCSLPLLLVLVTAWGAFHVFLAWKGSGVDSSRVLLGRGAPPESRRYTQGHQEKGKKGTEFLTKPSSSLLPAKTLTTLPTPTSAKSQRWGWGAGQCL